MDRRKLHERIAESLEERPDPLTIESEKLSKGGAWEVGFLPIGNGIYGELDWVPVNFDTDETANALLADAMLDVGKTLAYTKQTDGSMLLWVDGYDCYPAGNRHLCNVAAFVDWKGLADEG